MKLQAKILNSSSSV